jgi:hypothetical protein
MDLKRYWQEIRTLERSLPEFLWLVSIVDALRGRVGGSIAEVSAAHAALLLHSKSHRVATEEEIGAHKHREGVMKREAIEEKLRRQGRAIVALRQKN